jgi:hypothetical protein
MNKEKKLEILNRLTKDGDITLEEALILLETEKEYVYIPSNNNPWIQPNKPTINPYINPKPILPDWTYRPGTITYGQSASSNIGDFFPPICNESQCKSTNCICKNNI